MSLSWASTVMDAEHDVDPDQFEPGIPEAEQARVHAQDFLMMDFGLSASVGVTRWLEAEVRVPVRMINIEAEFLDAGGEPLPEFSSIHHRDETLFGVGDPSLGARLRLLRPDQTGGLLLDVRAGLSVPLGRTEPNPFELGRLGMDHQHMFFGTGTFDPIAGVEASYLLGDARLSASATARAPLYRNRHDYRGPAQITAALGADTSFGLARWRFLAGPEIFHETRASFAGEPARNSGRTDLIAAAGAFWLPSPAVTVHLMAKVPWTVRSEGGQLRMPFVAIAGATYAFPTLGR